MRLFCVALSLIALVAVSSAAPTTNWLSSTASVSSSSAATSGVPANVGWTPVGTALHGFEFTAHTSTGEKHVGVLTFIVGSARTGSGAQWVISPKRNVSAEYCVGAAMPHCSHASTSNHETYAYDLTSWGGNWASDFVPCNAVDAAESSLLTVHINAQTSTVWANWTLPGQHWVAFNATHLNTFLDGWDECRVSSTSGSSGGF